MPISTMIIKPEPGIKRDGTRFDGNFYTDGQWMRFQRGLPRKMGGYSAISSFLPEISRGFSTFTQQDYVYAHSGSANYLYRFTIDSYGNCSIMSNRTPVAVAATGSVTLSSGSSGGHIDVVTVNGVTITGGTTTFNTSLSQTATDLATNINSFTSSPDYTAVAVGTKVTITSVTTGNSVNGFVVVATTSGSMTATTTNMAGGANALTTSSDNKWMFDNQYDASSSSNYVIAHVSPNGGSIVNAVGGQIFYGSATGTTPLVEIPLPSGRNASGGMVVLHPYLFYYGNDGIISWSVAGTPTDLTGSGSGVARVWSSKIIKGLPLRAGSGTAPAGLFWAYDAVIRATFTGSSTVFQFDVIATDTSIMSADSVVDYDGVFYWVGVDRFLMFNGVVREVPNQMNFNWFFDNLNTAQRSKVFAFKNTHYGEVWFCYPRGTATECTHAVVYNVRENSWYDTELPNSGRSAGGFNNQFAAPILTGVTASNGKYKVWRHENGMDEIDGATISPILSYFETCDISAIATQNVNNYIRISQIEPDFIQSGDMTVQVTGRANARAPEVYGTEVSFPDNPTQPYEQVVVLKEQRRELRVKFTSNTVGGDYQMGQIIGHIELGDGTSIA